MVADSKPNVSSESKQVIPGISEIPTGSKPENAEPDEILLKKLEKEAATEYVRMELECDFYLITLEQFEKIQSQQERQAYIFTDNGTFYFEDNQIIQVSSNNLSELKQNSSFLEMLTGDGKFKKELTIRDIQNIKSILELPQWEDDILLGMAEMVSAYVMFKKIDLDIPDKLDFPQLFNKKDEYLFDGRLYQPPHAEHSWLTNLSWMLAHIHNGSKFIICSEISEKYLYRKTYGYQHQISGFAREVAVLNKLGYQIKVVDEIISIEPPPLPNRLADLSLLEIVMSTGDFIFHYTETMQHISEIKSRLKRPSVPAGESLQPPSAKRLTQTSIAPAAVVTQCGMFANSASQDFSATKAPQANPR